MSGYFFAVKKRNFMKGIAMTEKDLRFKIARQIAGFTQKQLAEAAGVKEHLIVGIETGRTAPPDHETAERISKLLNKRPFEIGI